jgi:hypothetical protein
VTNKLPEDAFAFYVALGPARSYDTVAEHFKVHKRTVVRSAAREKWPERLAAIEKKTREIVDSKLAEDRSEMDLRHRKLLRAMASRVASALQQYALTTGAEAFKGAETVIKLERLLAGEPSETNSLIIERVTRDEMARFLTSEPESDSEWEARDDDDDDDEPAAATG